MSVLFVGVAVVLLWIIFSLLFKILIDTCKIQGFKVSEVDQTKAAVTVVWTGVSQSCKFDSFFVYRNGELAGIYMAHTYTHVNITLSKAGVNFHMYF